MEDNDKEIITEMVNGMVETARQVLASDEMFKLGAKVQKKALDAMMKEGFTRKEAISIMSSGKQMGNK